jgi:RNA polymerase sigma factor (TIGR02999 family)
VTRLLKAWHGGDEEAYRQLSAMLYDELKRQAARCMRGERHGITLQATALVHEAFVRLAGAGEVDWQDRKHFLAVAARTMRRVLVDLVRAKARDKRGARAGMHRSIPASSPRVPQSWISSRLTKPWKSLLRSMLAKCG